MLRIGLSARGLAYKAGGAKEFIMEMAQRLPRVDSENQYIIYYSSQKEVLEIPLGNVTEVVVSAPHRLIWDHIALPQRLKRDKVDIALFFKGTIPFRCPCKTVVSVLDMIYFYPGLRASDFWDRQYMLRMISYSVRRANAVVAISNNTRLDLLRFITNIDPDKITVVPMASGLVAGPEVDVREKFKLGDAPYIFLSSSISPRKNIERALLALAAVKDKIPHHLVVTGGTAWGTTRVDEVVAQCGLADRFHKLGYVLQEDLFHLYKSADMYLMPSLYEGFSITLLEAMRAGCPVAASNVSSHPEVMDDAGLLFDPYSLDEMANSIRRVATDDRLKAELRERGLRQAGKFSWADSAIKLREVIQKAVTAER